ncbi:MAG: hypothetical protein H7318_04255 [Oligoflexus sp.]|nr:hypothetical protein [Oligoflexus sp.]
MKDLKEFKYQHQLDGSNLHRKPSGARFGVISGMLLGALAVGVLWPAGVKWVAKEKSAAHAMPAKKLIAMNEVTRPIDITRSPSQEKSAPKEKIVEDKIIEAEAAPKTGSAGVTKKVAREAPATRAKSSPSIPGKNNKVAAKPVAVNISKKTPKGIEKEKKTPVNVAKLEASAKAALPSRAGDTLEETQTVMSADDVQAKTDAALFKSDVASNEPADVALVTIYNAQYEKSTLASCKAHCLLNAKDAKGNTINAVISGPNFADILTEHAGTINITGKKTNIKNVDVFMVQSITFNLSSQKPVDPTGKTVSVTPTQIKKDVAPKRPYQGGTEAYEDLSSDPVPLR